MDSKQQRAPNWSAEEANLLVDAVAEHYSKLFGKHSLGVTQSAKMTIWLAISNKISALGCKRSMKECQKKFAYLKTDAKKYITHKNGTGGGPPLPETPPLYRRIVEMVPTEAMRGINGIER